MMLIQYQPFVRNFQKSKSVIYEKGPKAFQLVRYIPYIKIA